MMTLGALLVNPPARSGARTVRHLQVAADVLGCHRVEIANLFAVATRDVTAINKVGRSSDSWTAARSRIQEVVALSDHVLAGWGVRGLVGLAAENQRAQLSWLKDYLHSIGRQELWTLNGEARHPSRWHQYVSDRHGRATGESFADRLAMVLTLVPVAAL
jgi:hypothetical protein